MELSHTFISQEDGLLSAVCVGPLDENTSAPILGGIIKYAKESPQVLLIDFLHTTSIKTLFITGIIEVIKYIKASGGCVMIIPGPMEDILEITWVKKMTQVVADRAEGMIYARSHFPHILDFILQKKDQIQKTTHTPNIETLQHVGFFTDEEKKTIDTEKILKYAIISGASDIHLTTHKPLTYRIEWVLVKLENEPVLSPEHMNQIKKALLKNHPELEKKLDTTHDIDFGYISQEDRVSFRGNGAWSREYLNFTLRRIEQTSKSIQDLWLPEAIHTFLKAKQGLVLVTGPTGSGKSTTLVAMLEEINRTRGEKIITIEDPIEFLFTDQKSTFNQREVGRDTDSFVSAIRAAMREDPDVVMVGEMRDTETVEAALNLAETGHLVFSTLHTSGSVQTISRIIQFFPPEQQQQIYTRLADSIIGVISQRLVPRRDGIKKRIALFELMLVNSGIKNLIRSGDLAQMNNAIQMGRSEGMIPMYTYAQELEQKGLIHRDDYLGFFTNQDI